MLQWQASLHGESVRKWSEGETQLGGHIYQVDKGYGFRSLLSGLRWTQITTEDQDLELTIMSPEEEPLEPLFPSAQSWTAGQTFLLAVSEPFVDPTFYEGGDYTTALPEDVFEDDAVEQVCRMQWDLLRETTER